MTKRICVLGSAGNAGKKITELLLQHTDCQIKLTDRNQERLDNFVNELYERFDKNRIETIILDASETEKLDQAFAGQDMVVVASSTIDKIKNVMDAILKNKCDYIDIQGPSLHKYDYLYNQLDLSNTDQSIITDCGGWPGTLLPMIHFADRVLGGGIKTANIYGFFNLHWDEVYLSPQTVTEMELFYNENRFQPAIYRDGQWFTEDNTDSVLFDLGECGEHEFTPTFTREMSKVRDYFPSLEEVGFWKNFGTNKVKKFTIFKLMATGVRFDKPTTVEINVTAEDGHWIVGAGAAACVLQYLKKEEKLPGLRMMGEYVDPYELFNDFKKMNVDVEMIVR
jgi:saccharopine dehydrogenase-like NADP-dependent oxidoreductase